MFSFDGDGWTCGGGGDERGGIFKICVEGTPEEVQVALAGGADVNARNKDGKTALKLVSDKAEMREILIRAGAKE